jgi:hypothetical protein
LHKIWHDIATRTPLQAGGRTLAFFNPQGGSPPAKLQRLRISRWIFELNNKEQE